MEQILKDNEILMFVDFNNTLVDYDGEYNATNQVDMDGFSGDHTVQIRKRIIDCLRYFENKTGLTPVVCIVTNAKLNVKDRNDNYGIFEDFIMTFFPPDQTKNSILERDTLRFFRYISYAGQDDYYQINGHNNSDITFKRISFDERAMQIRYERPFKKKEMVARLLSVLDPKGISKYIVFAGDNIRDDYPMKEIETPDGVCKIFIRPHKSKKTASPYIKYQFAKAKGAILTMKSTKNGNVIKNPNYNNFDQIPEEEQKIIEDYSSGDTIFLTQKNSRGLTDGLYKAADFIAGQTKKTTETEEME